HGFPSPARLSRNFKSFALGEIFMKFPRATAAADFFSGTGLPPAREATSTDESRPAAGDGGDPLALQAPFVAGEWRIGSKLARSQSSVARIASVAGGGAGPRDQRARFIVKLQIIQRAVEDCFRVSRSAEP
ncbi:MAG: hypothetical protein K2G93_08715, partial [Rikenella sp.]|nr:hypothetical protein [Rikenella sp.]